MLSFCNNKTVIAAFVISILLNFVLCAKSEAENSVPVQTLDKIKNEQTTYLNSNHSTYNLTEVTDSAPENSITVKIGDKSYYYTPTDNKEVLKTLSSTGSVALIETTQDNALYATRDGKYYTYDTTKLKGSGYNLTETTVSDPDNLPANTIVKYEVNDVTKYYDPTTGLEVAEGDKQEGVNYKEVVTKETIPHYYTVTLNKTEYGDSSGNETLTYGWEKNSKDNLEFKLNPSNPVGQRITYIYDSSNQLSRLTNSSDNSSKIVSGLFLNQSTPFQGGAINNSGKLGSIEANFIGNYASSTSYSSLSGGAIYNHYGTIGSITGDFIGNHSSSTSSSPYVYGGAIYNYGYYGRTATIGDITGDFIGNHSSGSSPYVYGGAIYNYAYGTNTVATIGDITGDFIGNYASGKSSYGGAIYNYAKETNTVATIGDITGDFIGNYASSKDSANGGAIYNNAKNSSGTAIIGDITGDFIGNYASSSSSSFGDAYANGGAIYNYVNTSGAAATIGDITGDFIGNYASASTSSSSSAYGGAIYNYASSSGATATIGSITGDFIGNYASTSLTSYPSIVSAGAIYNYYGTIESIVGGFIGNYASASSYSSSANGGAIYNYYGTIESIVGDFIGNYASTSSSPSYKYSYYYSKAYGGAICNYRATIGSITGDFIGNYAEAEYTGASSSVNTSALGGAIYNYISSSSDKATIGLTNNNFLNNYAKVTVSRGNKYAKGGAIFTNYDLTLNADNGTSLISGNYTETNGVKDQNAIYVANLADSSGRIQRNTTFTLNAVNNGKIQIDDKIAGGSFYESSSKFWETSGHAYTLALTGDSTGTISLYNDVTNANVTAQNVTVDFANNDTHAYNFVSLTDNGGTKYNIDVDLTQGTADTISTKNLSTGTIVLNTLNFINSGSVPTGSITIQIIKNTNPSSTLQLAFGNNIQFVNLDPTLSVVENILKTLPNTVNNNTILAQEDGIYIDTTTTENDSITIAKDKVYTTVLELLNQKTTPDERNFNFVDGSIYYVQEDLGTTTAGTLNINGLGATTPSTIDANNHTMFDLQNETTLNINNTTITNAKDYAINAQNANATVNLTNASIKNTQGTGIISNVDLNITADGGKSEFTGNTTAIEIAAADKTITMTSQNKGEITLGDKITGTAPYTLALQGDNNSKIQVNNKIENANIILDNTNLYLNDETNFNVSNSLTLNSGTISLNNDKIGTMHLPTLTLAGTTNLSLDVDLANESMDRITADTYTITPDAILNVNNLTLISTTEKESVKILFADEQLANNVEYTGESPTSYKGTNTVYSPIYKYDVNYEIDKDDKLGYFFFNRASSGSGNASDVFNPSVLAPSVATQAGAFSTQVQTFNYAFQHADTFMNIPYLERVTMKNSGRYALSPTGDATDVGNFSPLMTKEPTAGFWVKPYASFENIPLKNGPKVSNITYGTLIGYDSVLTPIKHGWERVLTGYVGYNGASQRYSGVDAYQNGGLLGGTATLYKGNFFNATTLSVGASAGDASTMYGSENYTMLLAGIGNKTGYNFEFCNGKIILQPSFLISYTFVNTFDYTNGAGVRIKSDPLNAIQLAPGIKLIGNTKNGWQPYIGVSMIWNLMDESKVTANDVRLPEMSIDPYVQYGVGVQKRFGERLLGFMQAMIQNGGRNGVSLTAGFRWKLGK